MPLCLVQVSVPRLVAASCSNALDGELPVDGDAVFALLPSSIVVGLGLGADRAPSPLGASLLVSTNVICVNPSAVVTLLSEALRPGTWWEAEQAGRATRVALVLVLCGFLLAVLVALIAAGLGGDGL